MSKADEKLLIDIPKWDNYQKKMSRRSRDWIAMSTEMMSDPSVRALSSDNFRLWVGLLLHAGKVGVPFKITRRLAKDMFGMYHTSTFEQLTEQGLISVNCMTVQDITRQDKTVALDAPTAKPSKPKSAKPEVDYYAPESYPPALNVQAWQEWVAYRKTANLPKYKTFRQMENLAKYPVDVQAKAVDASITQGYTGVFPEKFFSTKSEKQMQTNINAMQEFLNG